MIDLLVLSSIFSCCYYAGYKYVAKQIVFPYDIRTMGLPKNYEMACNWNETRMFSHYINDIGYIYPKGYNIYTYPNTGITGVIKDLVLPHHYQLSNSPNALWYTDTLYQVVEVSSIKYYSLMTICTVIPGSLLAGAAIGVIFYFNF